MPTPFLRRFFPHLPAEGTAERLLDHEYQLECLAAGETDNSRLREYLQFLSDTHTALAQQNLRALAGGAGGTLADLLAAPYPAGTLSFAPADVPADDRARLIARLRERGMATTALLEGTVTGDSGTQAEAVRALKNGMIAQGRDQQEEFKDALSLLREAQGGAVGARNYVVWFQIAWILWKQNDLAGAEEAFYQAYRLSGGAGDVFHYLSIRHRAYLQYLIGAAGDAVQTIGRAAELFPSDPETLCDAARYAAASGDPASAAGLLHRYLRAEPTGAITVLADAALASVLPTLADALLAETRDAERAAAQAVARLADAGANARTAIERAGIAGGEDDALRGGVVDAGALLARLAGTLSYLASVGIARTAEAQTAAVYARVREMLADAAATADARLVRPRVQKERLLSERKRWREDAAKIERSARSINVNLSAPPRRTLFGRINAEHAAMYDNYQTARGHMEITEEAMKTELPRYEEEIAAGEAEITRIRETLAWLDERAAA